MTLSMRSALSALAAAALAALFVPAAAQAATAAKVVCKDGTTDEGGRGACSGHGGVDKAATAKAQGGDAKAAAEPKAEKASKAKKEKADEGPKPTVVCKDGTTDEGGRGACRGHGGVDKGASAKAKGGAPAGEAKGEAKKEKADEPKGTVVCKDGTTDEGGRGACSGHGGVDKDAGARAHGGAASPATPATPATRAEPATPAAAAHKAEHEKADPAKGPPTARCKDGTLSYAEHHTGACSRHGGVEEWLDKK